MPFGQQPTDLFRDDDAIYGDEMGRFLARTGIAEVKTAHRRPWQNPLVERYRGTLRRELLDHVIVLNEEHLKRLLKEFIEEYYHRHPRPPLGRHMPPRSHHRGGHGEDLAGQLEARRAAGSRGLGACTAVVPSPAPRAVGVDLQHCVVQLD